jgi:hypothetical protein
MSEPTKAELNEFFDKRLLATMIREANMVGDGFEDCAQCGKSGLVDGAICPACNGYGLLIPDGKTDQDEEAQS